MKPFTKLRGIVTLLDLPDVDTDQIIPKQFLKRIERTGFGQFLFYDWRFVDRNQLNPNFEMNQSRYRGAEILVTRSNFGCGSSREHAPWALLDYGFKSIVAPSFADIFYNNCFKNGMLPVTLPDAQVDGLFRRAGQKEGYRLTADLETQTIADEAGLHLSFDLDPFRRECLLKGLDDIGLSLRFEDKIAAYEKKHQPKAVLYGSIDASFARNPRG